MKHPKPLIVGVLSAMVTACAAMPPLDPHPPATLPVYGLVIERSAWLAPSDSWFIGSTGNVSHQSTDPSAPQPVTRILKDFRISSTDFQTLLTLLQPAHDKLMSGIPCDGPLPTDTDGVDIEWVRTGGANSSLSLYMGCNSPVMASTLEAYRKAVDLLLSLEAAAP